jgi:rhodanese-related sulfurtransferase
MIKPPRPAARAVLREFRKEISRPMALPFEITAPEVKRKLDAGEELALIDVREAFELSQASIAGAEPVPMNTVPPRLQFLDGLADEKLLVVFCHHGIRSLSVVSWLRQQGVENCVSMAGGIDSWSLIVDPAVKRY